MKLYTRTGDDGTTGLFSGSRVGKDHPRIEAYGTIDELNACIGLAAASCGTSTAGLVYLRDVLIRVQAVLFELGADLATPEGGKNAGRVARIDDACVKQAEGWIDEVESANTTLREFVLPGGTEFAARLHLARTVCRRAERLMVALARSEPINEAAVRWVNRLSDLLFAMARRANREAGVEDVRWSPRSTGQPKSGPQ